MKPGLLFLTLNTFSATGGIEKVCRVAAKALNELAGENGSELLVYSMYDGVSADTAYLPQSKFKGFAGHRLKFSLASVKKGRSSGTVLLSHINLLPVGYLIKKLSPKTRLVLIAHGIEVWDEITGFKKKLLQVVDLFLPVSTYTAKKLQTVQGIAAENIQVLNNCLDPYLQREVSPKLETSLRQKYGFTVGDFVLLTVTRLKFSEQYKGYDKVVKGLGSLKSTMPNLKYLIVGKWDNEEKARLDLLIKEAGVEAQVIFVGFAKDEELSAHFTIADAYVMPSTGEGFGIVFIEALFYGLPVMAGNLDGSVDALANGAFGQLVNPNDQAQVNDAIKNLYLNTGALLPPHNDVMARFGFETYKQKLRTLLYGQPLPLKRVPAKDLA